MLWNKKDAATQTENQINIRVLLKGVAIELNDHEKKEYVKKLRSMSQDELVEEKRRVTNEFPSVSDIKHALNCVFRFHDKTAYVTETGGPRLQYSRHFEDRGLGRLRSERFAITSKAFKLKAIERYMELARHREELCDACVFSDGEINDALLDKEKELAIKKYPEFGYGFTLHTILSEGKARKAIESHLPQPTSHIKE